MTDNEFHTVPMESEGERIDSWLGPLLGSRSYAQRLIEQGLVRIDGDVVNKRRRVYADEVVEVGQPENNFQPDALTKTINFEVPYRDDDLMIVNKPAGVVVHPGRGNYSNTLVQALAGEVAGGEDAERPGVVHRLDRDTSGLLIFARHVEAHRRLQEMIRQRTVTREYRALVEGQPPARSGLIDAPIGRDRRIRTRISIDSAEPRAARTHFEQLEAYPGYSLLSVRLETGRTHQIRAHFKAIGHPVAGDPEYGTAGLLGLERQFLHAYRLAFEHPFSGEDIEVTAALPDDLTHALRKLTGNS